MNKLKIKFTPEEKKKLRKAKIKLSTLENYSFNEILFTVNGDAERTAEIRLQLFKWVGGPEDKYLNNNLNSIIRATSPLKGIEALIASVSQINRITDSVRNFDRILGKSSMLGNDITRMMEIPNVNRIAGIDKLRASTGLGFLGDNQENIQRMIVGSPFIGGGISKFMESISLAKTSGMDRIHSTLGTGLFEELTKKHRTFEITKGISSLLSSLPNASELAMGSRLSNGIPHSILREAEFKKLGISSLIGEMNTSSIFERAHLTGISSAMAQAAAISRLAESNLGSFEWSRIGSRMALSAAEINSTQKNFLNLTAQYSDVLKIINTKPNWIYDAPEVAKMPAVDFYSSSRLLKIVTSQDEESAEIRKTDTIIDEENTDAIVRFLPQLDPGLINMWNGATYALNSDNPDKIRHFITSLRELFGHVMRLMASDQHMNIWDSAGQYQDEKGRPTRKGRFLYICRNIEASKKEFAKLMMNEVDSTILLIDLFQGGTHSIQSKFSSEELQLIKIKSETTLRFFLNVEFEINRA